VAAKSVEEILEVLLHETDIILSGRNGKASPSASLASFGFDSLSFVELLIAIERNFNVKLIDAGIGPEDLKTLEALARCIHRAI